MVFVYSHSHITKSTLIDTTNVAICLHICSNVGMKKDEMRAILGWNVETLCDRMGYKSVQAFYQKPYKLSLMDQDRVIGAALRHGLSIPKKYDKRMKE